MTPADFYRIFPEEQRNEQIKLPIRLNEARKMELIDDRVRKLVKEALASVTGDF